ncbi:MAG: hypothetical protein M1827_007738 [Pycnora praestabilis]|nr:MAG: hypothetical protein M1827_007738 [Pycnora praestabilis]
MTEVWAASSSNHDDTSSLKTHLDNGGRNATDGRSRSISLANPHESNGPIITKRSAVSLSATPPPVMNGSLQLSPPIRNGQVITPEVSPRSEITAWLSGQVSEDNMQELQEKISNERFGRRTNSAVPSEDQTDHYAAQTVSKVPTTNGTLERIVEEGEKEKRRNSQMDSPSMPDPEREKVLKLSPSKIQELTSSPTSLPLLVTPPGPTSIPSLSESLIDTNTARSISEFPNSVAMTKKTDGSNPRVRSGSDVVAPTIPKSCDRAQSPLLPAFTKVDSTSLSSPRPSLSSRTVSTPPSIRKNQSSSKLGGLPQPRTPQTKNSRAIPPPLDLEINEKSSSQRSSILKAPPSPDLAPSPMPSSIPLPPFSIPTYLQLEISSDRPSPLYIHRSMTSDFPYESSAIKFERLLSFLLLPPQLEQVLWFGALACLDAWLYSFTILPLRFLKALAVLCKWWGQSLVKETRDILGIVHVGLGRMWQQHRRRSGSASSSSAPTPIRDGSRSRSTSVAQNAPQPSRISVSVPGENTINHHSHPEPEGKHRRSSVHRHSKAKSAPSTLLPSHKADLLKGFVVLFSCIILMHFDASRMYHSIRGQAAIKLYVIYNVLEVCDRLFSALGQDVFECLFSRETLERTPEGRSKLLRPFWMFLLALVYNVVHSTALFYQVITLNVAVNSYSNALLTLLMSNQFVEIKSTVFKKFEKENLFQLTCADVVERFQLWLMLIIIAMRNIVEVGGFNVGSGGLTGSLAGSGGASSNSTGTGALPLKSSSILPRSFTLFPKWTGQVMGPFLLVLGSEMLVDWLKHAYINKFNNVKPAIYGRFLDVLAKDYYSNAFADQNLTRRLGLPVIPLSCLFIRASLQTYQMFLATHMPSSIPSTATSISVESSATTSPATTAALQHIDQVFRRALNRSSFSGGIGATRLGIGSWLCLDDIITFTTMLTVFLVLYLVLLALKLILGMCLLSFARSRYKGMKEREKLVIDLGGRRVGGWGVVEVDEDKRRWIYHDDPDAARALREREKASREREGQAGKDFSGVQRYTMAAKRIW